MVIGQGMKLSAVGIVAGLIASLALTRLMRSMLVGVAPTDPLTLVAVAVLFFSIAAVACWLPARRAAGLDPAIALRDDSARPIRTSAVPPLYFPLPSSATTESRCVSVPRLLVLYCTFSSWPCFRISMMIP